MAAARRVMELEFTEQELADLERVSRSRTEPASHVQRARILLGYRQTPSLYVTGRAIGVTHQTVERCLRRARDLGVKAALDDRPRPGRERTISSEARTFDLACRKPKDLDYPHEVWTTRLLTAHVRERGPQVGHACLARLSQGTLCKILAAHEIKPHKVKYYLQNRDPEFAEKMAKVLEVYREVETLKVAARAQPSPHFSDEREGLRQRFILSYEFSEAGDEWPQAGLGHVGYQLVEHAALAEQRMGSAFGGVDLEMTIHA